jgi:hypothetical protein
VVPRLAAHSLLSAALPVFVTVTTTAATATAATAAAEAISIATTAAIAVGTATKFDAGTKNLAVRQQPKTATSIAVT